ncbi:MAG: hypothetical protein KME09_01375 [Pleurocapsa minor HA4230-MV1]|jgi:hypothetical protein|nr:hypothetical protein [Pleurocapsa minor HA4230-MV1]
MSSILLSFVGNQDPGSDKNDREGSIVTLICHLLEQERKIKGAILLYTSATEDAAHFTKEWLLSSEIKQLSIAPEQIELIAVDDRLSKDPIDLLLATQEAKKAIAKAQLQLKSGDRLELNSSSGTPAMKAAWSILQASGLATNSHLWQVRNPNLMLSDQERVFESNITVLKKTIDIKIIKEQVACHNYYGALVTFKNNNLLDNGVSTLLKCASYRLSSAFETSFEQIRNHAQFCGQEFHQQSKQLAARQHREIIKEIYFQAEIKAKNQEYSELLVKIFVFQESVLFYLLKQELIPEQDINSVMNEKLIDKLNKNIKDFDDGKLQKYLNEYRLKNGQKLFFATNYNRITMIAIVDYFYDKNTEICQLLQNLNAYCQKRNDYIHQLKGIDHLEADQILFDLKQILKSLNIAIKPNPFDTIKQKIERLLDVQ